MLFLLLICWPVAEILVAVQVAHAIGALYTLLLLVAGWPLGTWAMRTQGRAAWRRLTAAVAEGRTPGREVVDGGAIAIGGMLVILPGFITDVVGLALLLPPSRALLRGALVSNLRSRFTVQARHAGGRPSDVDSTARDLDPPQLRP